MPRFAHAGVVASSLLLSGIWASEHDRFVMQTKLRHSPQAYDVRAGTSGTGRRLEAAKQPCEDIYKSAPNGPLRIGYELVNAAGLSEEQIGLVNDLMTNATRYWGLVLRVRQATKPLRLHPGTIWSTYGEDRIYKSADIPMMCGGEVEVPTKYLEPVEVCQDFCAVQGSGCEGSCVQGGQCACNYNDWLAQKGDYCCTVKTGCLPNCTSAQWDLGALKIAKSGEKAYAYCTGSCVQTPGGVGAEEKDLFLFVQVKDSPACVDSDGLQAYASACNMDQCDRPIFGYINFCKSRLSAEPDQLANQLSTAVHEVAHVLGFSSGLFPYFRDQQGKPLVERDPQAADKFLNAVMFDCDEATNKVTNWGSGQGKSYVDLSPRIANKFNERGFSNCGCPIGTTTLTEGACFATAGKFQTPHCVVKMTLPTVVEKAREHFDCADLEGAELENQDTSSCVVFGSHWEGRLFNDELMAAVATSGSTAFVSGVTLALFQDSGWYDVDWTKQDELVKNVHWGYKQGCEFARKRCVEDGVSAFPHMFCTKSGDDACSLDRKLVRRCSLTAADPPDSLPAAFNYFGSGGLHGKKASLEYCPTYSVRLINRICTSTKSYANSKTRETLGEESRCFMSSLQEGAAAAGASVPNCYRAVCSADGGSYELRIADGKGSSMTLGNCTAADEQLSVAGLQGSVVCVDPVEICQVEPSWHHLGVDMAVLPAAAPGEGGADGDDSDASGASASPDAASPAVNSSGADDEGDGSAMKDASARRAPWLALALVLAVFARPAEALGWC